jgi:glutaredoxin-related protein
MIYIMYVLIGKEKCNQCNILKNLLDEKGIQYHYVDMLEVPHKTMTYLKMYYSSYPMVLNIKYFSFYNKSKIQNVWGVAYTAYNLLYFIADLGLKSLPDYFQV